VHPNGTTETATLSITIERGEGPSVLVDAEALLADAVSIDLEDDDQANEHAVDQDADGGSDTDLPVEESGVDVDLDALGVPEGTDLPMSSDPGNSISFVDTSNVNDLIPLETEQDLHV